MARRADGVFLKCKAKSGKVYWVPVVSKWGYLGAVLTYKHPEKETLDRRMKAAEYAFQRLKPVIGCKRGVPLHLRLQVYQACVMATSHYAIFAAGFSPSEAAHVHRKVMNHLRYIAGSPRHITRETNEHLCSRLVGRLLPLQELCRLWESKHLAWSQRRAELHPEDIGLNTPPYPDITAICSTHAQPGGVVGEMEAWKCRFCDRRLPSRAARSTHESRAHKQEAAAAKANAQPFTLCQGVA